jgi:hypothetical protein
MTSPPANLKKAYYQRKRKRKKFVVAKTKKEILSLLLKGVSRKNV